MSSTMSLPHVVSNTPTRKARFLMCRPDVYDVTYVINPWMAGNIHHASQPLAAQQWQALYEQVTKLADVELVTPVAGSPDMVFTANAGLERDGVVAISSFAHVERQDEEDHFARWFEDAGYTVRRIPRATPFEGEGDALFSVDGTTLWIGDGLRTNPASHEAIAQLWDVAVVSLRLIDPRFYHLDTCFAPLAGGYALYFPAAFDEASRAKIEAFYPVEKRIIVEEQDAVKFACNAVNVDRTVIVNQISDALANTLTAHGFAVIQTPLGEFMRAGGAAKCLVMKLSRLG